MSDSSLSSTSSFDRAIRLVRGLPQRLRRPVARGTYSAEIDGLRFIAIAIVVLGHFMERAVRFFPVAHTELGSNSVSELLLRPGGGVYLFFTISGFIITRQFIKARVEPLSPTFLKAYFGRRILRIEPPYIILLTATWLLLIVVGYVPDQTTHFDVAPHSLSVSLIGSIFYLHDILWGTFPRLFPPGWSLEVEVQFYLLAPLLFWAFFKTPRGPARMVLGALGLIAGAWMSLVPAHHIDPNDTDVSIYRFFHFFWLGMVFADLHDWIIQTTKRLSPRLTGWIGWIGLAIYFVAPVAPNNDVILGLAIRAVTFAALFAIFASAFARGSSFRAFCERPWISVIGGACYSIYLTHLQAIQAMTSLLAKVTPQAGLGLVLVYLAVEIAVVLVIGMMFYAVIERTFMIKDWPSQLQRRMKNSFAVLSLAGGKSRS